MPNLTLCTIGTPQCPPPVTMPVSLILSMPRKVLSNNPEDVLSLKRRPSVQVYDYACYPSFITQKPLMYRSVSAQCHWKVARLVKGDEAVNHCLMLRNDVIITHKMALTMNSMCYQPGQMRRSLQTE